MKKKYVAPCIEIVEQDFEPLLYTTSIQYEGEYTGSSLDAKGGTFTDFDDIFDDEEEDFTSDYTNTTLWYE